MDFQQARFNMVEQQIRTWDVLDQDVLDVLQRVPRDAFVPEDFRLLAYSDTRIPLGHSQSMMTPKVEARIAQALKPRPTERVLEIGTGSGYLTALLAQFARTVLSLELYEDLATAAQRKFRAMSSNAMKCASAIAVFSAVACTSTMPPLAVSTKLASASALESSA